MKLGLKPCSINVSRNFLSNALVNMSNGRLEPEIWNVTRMHNPPPLSPREHGANRHPKTDNLLLGWLRRQGTFVDLHLWVSITFNGGRYGCSAALPTRLWELADSHRSIVGFSIDVYLSIRRTAFAT